MAFVKCPRCELNYILSGEKLCSVCDREVKGEPDREHLMELCLECGERTAARGEELCLFCLKQHGVRKIVQPEDTLVTDTSLDLHSVSALDEIEIDIDEDLPTEDFDEADEEFDEVEGVDDTEGSDFEDEAYDE